MPSSKVIIREVTPPVLLRLARRSSSKPETTVLEHEAGPDFYDDSFEARKFWRWHYSRSPWYYIWTVLGDRLVHMDDPSVLDVGCGSGQIAEMLKDMGLRSYTGFDFSPKRIEWAQAAFPEFRFEMADAYTTTLFDDVQYNAVVCTEFLEHVERDLVVLGRIRPGTRFLGTVPDFGGGSHVRFFQSAEEVEERYAAMFDPFSVTTFVRPGGKSRQFLLDGVTKNQDQTGQTRRP
jgi:SAM-dependent methyltransferase